MHKFNDRTIQFYTDLIAGTARKYSGMRADRRVDELHTLTKSAYANALRDLSAAETPYTGPLFPRVRSRAERILTALLVDAPQAAAPRMPEKKTRQSVVRK